MKERFIKTIRRSGTSFAINIPIEIINLLDIKEGDIVKVEIEKVKKNAEK